ncbi:MAG: hypothetical protein INR69_17960 [Mucilaginibacter polytrichastri]|nr:hypothetical protein [Mucilaginibacter polytrichastri]
METLIVKPKTHKQLAAVKAVLSALDVSFKKAEDVIYDPDFVAEIKQAEKDLADGKGTSLPTAELWK